MISNCPSPPSAPGAQLALSAFTGRVSGLAPGMRFIRQQRTPVSTPGPVAHRHRHYACARSLQGSVQVSGGTIGGLRWYLRAVLPISVAQPTRGQAVVEFALLMPLILFLVLAVGDFGRVYTSLVAVEAAAREAADLGAFDPGNWNTDIGGPGVSATNPGQTVVRMQRAACTSAAASHLEGYAEPPGTVNHATCTNPTMTCTLEPSGTDCATYTGGSGGCGDTATDPPCVVHVQLSYTFDTIVHAGFLPTTITFTRDARFAVSALSTGAP